MALTASPTSETPQTLADAINELKAALRAYPPPMEAGMKITTAIDTESFNAIFTLHSQVIRDTGKLSYVHLAHLLWQKLVAPQQQLDNIEYQQFRDRMLTNLRRMDMHSCLYPDVAPSLVNLVEKHGTAIKELVLWSTGDREAGIQLAKVMSTGLPELLEDLRARLPQSFPHGVKSFICEYKLDALGLHIETLLREDDEPIKLVIIEDSRKNLRKVAQRVANLPSKRDKERLQIVPIFARYSAEGANAHRKALAENTLDIFEEEMRRFNAIDSIADLLDDRFEEILKDARLLVDFDGVLVINGEGMDGTRLARAQAIWPALVQACMHAHGLDEKAAIVHIQKHAQEIHKAVSP